MVAASVWTGSDGCGASEKSCASPDGDRTAESGEGGARLRYDVAQANDSRAQAPAARRVTTSPPRPPRCGFARPHARFDRADGGQRADVTALEGFDELGSLQFLDLGAKGELRFHRAPGFEPERVGERLHGASERSSDGRPAP